jgi:hypothetical protein
MHRIAREGRVFGSWKPGVLMLWIRVISDRPKFISRRSEDRMQEECHGGTLLNT